MTSHGAVPQDIRGYRSYERTGYKLFRFRVMRQPAEPFSCIVDPRPNPIDPETQLA